MSLDKKNLGKWHVFTNFTCEIVFFNLVISESVSYQKIFCDKKFHLCCNRQIARFAFKWLVI